MAIGSLIVDVEGTSLSAEDKEILQHPLIAGVIFFKRNYEDISQLQDLIQSIRELRSELLLAVDHEGGRVQRFTNGFTRMPALEQIGDLYNKNPTQAMEYAKAHGTVIALELSSIGIDINFAPVLDLNLGICEVIGSRAFHSDPEVVAALAGAFIDGLNQGGMQAVAKHFPGHGGVTSDSHLELPHDNRDFKTLKQQDLIPYMRLAPKLRGVLTAHIIFDAIDDKLVTFSSFWLNQMLRQQCGFTGVIFSDDLSMEAAKSFAPATDRVILALNSGCDVALLCNDRPAVIEVLDNLDYQQYVSLKNSIRLQALKSSSNIKFSQLQQDNLWQQSQKMLAVA